eukprot:TRINITY_DN5222_c0_g1_i1.p1 TRINITY_DN5222_c0_g1~~TRINITY_DN5222_c0_g1_i1.p1  ORF type:complete len:492 (-),score=95.07 TRINITY_DN5222_c0_g1_i1:135-1610(-)
MDPNLDEDEDYKYRFGLFVRGFGELVDQQQLENSFGSIGKVVRVQTGQPGLAFVDMETEKDCLEAIRLLDGTELGGQKISVVRAKGPIASRERTLNPPNTFRCYNCAKPGHLARECKEKPRNPAYADTKGTKLVDIGRRYHPYERPMDRRGSDPRDDRMRDDRGRDDRMRDPQRMRNDSYRNDPYPEDRQRDPRFNTTYDRFRDDRIRDDRIRDERMRDDRFRDERYRDERYRDDRDINMARPSYDTGRGLYGSSMGMDPREISRGRSPPPFRRDERFRETDRLVRNDRFIDERARPRENRFDDRPNYNRDYRPERPSVRSDYRPTSRPDDRFATRNDYTQNRRIDDFPQERRSSMDSFNSNRRSNYGGRDFERPRSPGSYGNGNNGMMGGNGGQGNERDYNRSYGRSPPRDIKRDDSVNRMGQSGANDRYTKGYGVRPGSPQGFSRSRSYDDYPPRSRSPERFRAKTPPPHSPRSPANQSSEMEKQQRTP